MIASYNIPKAKVITLFGALCLFFALLEKLLPQVGFFRYGLSNLPILLALPIFRGQGRLPRDAPQGPGGGHPSRDLCAHVFPPLSQRLPGRYLDHAPEPIASGPGSVILSLIGISVLGGFASNLVQLGFGYRPHLRPRLPGLGSRYLLGVGTISSIHNRYFCPGPNLQEPLASTWFPGSTCRES
jgi:hypothetical protein